MSPQRFVATYDEIAPFLDLVDAANETRLSFFEAMTGMAFAAFAVTVIAAVIVIALMIRFMCLRECLLRNSAFDGVVAHDGHGR